MVVLRRYVEVYGTGHQIETMGREYVDTFQLMGGSLVFHVFEVR